MSITFEPGKLRGRHDTPRSDPGNEKEPRDLLLLELEVQYQDYGNNKDSDDGPNDPFVPVHPPGH